jgi:hypothetical protein
MQIAFLIACFTINEATALCPQGMRNYFTHQANLSAAASNQLPDTFKNYRRYRDPVVFSSKKSELLDSIQRWSQVAQRGILMRQLRRVRIKSFLRDAFKFDDGLAIAEQLRPLFFKVQFSYYRYSRINRILEKLRNIPVTDINLMEQKLRELQSSEKTDLTAIAQSPTPAGRLAQEIFKLENEKVSLALELAKHIDEYSEATLFLERTKNDSSATPSSRTKAEFILGKLQGKYVVDSFLISIGRSGERTPTLEKLNEVIDREPMAEIRQLEQERTLERWTALVSRLPTSEIHLLTDRLLSKIPLLNKPAIRSFLRLSIDNRDILAHYPKIDRLLEGEKNSPQEMWEYVRNQDAFGQGTDSFLLTFARRADARDTWRQVYDFGQQRKRQHLENGRPNEADVKLAEKLERLESEASRLPPLPAWHHPGKSATLRYVIDGLMTVGAVVLAAYAYDSFFNNLTGNSEEERSESAIDQESELSNTVMEQLETVLP